MTTARAWLDPDWAMALVEANVPSEQAKAIVQAVESHDALIDAVREAYRWNENDLKSIEQITPSEDMLKARRKTLKAALALAKKGV